MEAQLDTLADDLVARFYIEAALAHLIYRDGPGTSVRTRPSTPEGK